MLKNYFKIAFRSFKKNKAYSAINIFGLAIGITSLIFILLFIQDELSYDKFHENKDRIYRVTGSYDRGEQKRVESALTTYQLGPQIDFQFPQVEKAVRISPNNNSNFLINGENIRQENIVFADSGFFDVFSFPLVEGDKKHLFKVANEAVLTQSTAQKMFGDVNPIGSVIEMDGIPITISGIMKDTPSNSHFSASMIISSETIHDQYPSWVRDNWSGTSHYTYILLDKNISPEVFEQELNKYWDSTFKEYGDLAQYAEFSLQPLSKIHLESNLVNEIQANGNLTYVYIFGAIGFIIVVIAAINYMNLATAQSLNRTKEVGIRKVLGAEKGHVKKQFLSESLLISTIAFVVALISVEIIIPFFNQITGKNIDVIFPNDLPLIFAIFASVLVIGLISGGYPSFWLSRLSIIRTLKSNSLGSNRGGELLKRGLVTLQFSISAIVLVSTILISKQIQFVQNKNLGINPEQVLVIPFQNSEIANRFTEIKEELIKESWVSSVTATNNPLPGRITNWRPYRTNGSDENLSVPTIVVHDDFIETIEAEISEGRNFSKDRISDRTNAYLINEAAARFLNLTNPVGSKLVGSTFTGNEWGSKDAEIIGVVKDFHFTSLHDEIQPVVFSLSSEQTTPLNNLAVRVRSEDFETAISGLERTWNTFSNGVPFEYSFLQDDISLLYDAEKKFLQLFSIFTTLAIIISCLGILGLVAFAVNQKMKEICIRKVLGADVVDIIWSFVKSYSQLIIISNLLAWPIAYVLMKDWLEDFAYRVPISGLEFVIAGSIIFLISIGTISLVAYKAALLNPVKSLKSE
ncbi:MAG: ABC transporter permease [Balneola sp.]|nr:ABC transporter permease [Balneola sp.]MBO6651786.1 ABC transporter permease [Balneola sp.]MBO6711979.1 ABC transporter permease [Balneola sp.]MBO6800175.1 ABC transporter permease [Balneola sp.]MBO6871679.1 ABC transporter permease [Balneola sp.]